LLPGSEGKPRLGEFSEWSLGNLGSFNEIVVVEEWLGLFNLCDELLDETYVVAYCPPRHGEA
jgi:hypothetical protein